MSSTARCSTTIGRRFAIPTSGRYQPGFCAEGWRAAGEIYVGGQVPLAGDGSVLAPGDVEEQARIVFERVRRVPAEGGADLEDLVKLNLFLVGEPGSTDIADNFHKVARVWGATASDAHPAMTPVRVYGLPGSGVLVQADGIAINEPATRGVTKQREDRR